ncbi:MAG: hypothetical protein LLF89_01030 [Spirochaetaceae bacterium]|nr:hypothetical protein [Spirochaetaceae bacterium]
MRSRFSAVLLIASLTLYGASAVFAQTVSPDKATDDGIGPSQIVFTSIALQGFSAPGLLADGEYLNLGIGIDPFQTEFASPALGLHWLFPFNPLDIEDSRIGLSLDLTIGRFLGHPLGRLFVRKTSLSPMLSLAGYASLGTAASPLLMLSCQPLRFFSGDGYYSAAAIDIAFDSSLQYRGWGIRLFDFTHFIH